MMSGFAWLPDSTGIVYSSSRGGTIPYLPTLGLWQVTLRDRSVRRVTSGETSYRSPDISRRLNMGQLDEAADRHLEVQTLLVKT